MRTGTAATPAHMRGLTRTIALALALAFFIAAPALIRAIYRVRTGDEAARVTKGWAT